MSTRTDLFLSIRPEWIEKILAGEKDVELRRDMPVKASPGCRVILYETGKHGAVRGVADLVEAVYGKGPACVFVPHGWHIYGRAGMTMDEVEAYFSKVSEYSSRGGAARRPGGLVLANVREIDTLQREKITGPNAPAPWTGFRIPQSWGYVERAVADSIVGAAPAPSFRPAAADHPPGRYAAMQGTVDGWPRVLEVDENGLWFQRYDCRLVTAVDPVGFTYGPLPEWPEAKP